MSLGEEISDEEFDKYLKKIDKDESKEVVEDVTPTKEDEEVFEDEAYQNQFKEYDKDWKPHEKVKYGLEGKETIE